MPGRPRLSFSPLAGSRASRVSLLSLAAISIALGAPGAAAAGESDRGFGVVAQQASNSEERAARELERAERRAARQAERAQRRAAREEERAARRAARHKRSEGSSGEPGGDSHESGTGETPPESGASAPASAGHGCHLSIESGTSRVTAGETVTLFGRLECSSVIDSAGRQLTVYQSARGTDAASPSIAGSVTTEADGSFKLTSAPLESNTLFRIRVGKHGAHTVVKVAPKVTLAVPGPAAQRATARGGSTRWSRATFSGTVRPATAGALVALQVAYAGTDGRWRAVAFGRVDADGGYSITHGFRMPGQTSVRVVAHPGVAKVAGVSEALAYEVPQAQNPRLTIASSADPLSYGASVTLTGVAAGAANQPVTLLARTRGNAFAAVASGTTDDGGHYTFTQTPLANTYYRVSDSSTASTALFEGVRRTLTLDAPPSALQSGAQLTLTGTVNPTPASKAVYLERQYASGINFHVIAVGTVDEAGHYSLAHSFSDVRGCVLRVKVPRDAQNEGTTSAPFEIQLTAAPAGALGPEAPVEAASLTA